MSAETRYKEDFIYYTGTRVNYEVLTNPSKKQLFMRYVLGVPDLPLSMIMDTAFLPVDFIVYSHEMSKSGKSQAVMQEIYSDAEKMLSILSLNQLSHFQDVYVDKAETQTSLFDINLQKLNEITVKSLSLVLKKFVNGEFKEPSYERAGRLYYKGEDYLVSFRKGGEHWLISTLSQDLK